MLPLELTLSYVFLYIFWWLTALLFAVGGTFLLTDIVDDMWLTGDEETDNFAITGRHKYKSHSHSLLSRLIFVVTFAALAATHYEIMTTIFGPL